LRPAVEYNVIVSAAGIDKTIQKFISHAYPPCPAPFCIWHISSGAIKSWCAVINVSTGTPSSTKPKTKISTHLTALRRHMHISGLIPEPGNSWSKAQYKRFHFPAADVWDIRLFQRSYKVSDSTHFSETERIILLRILKCKRNKFVSLFGDAAGSVGFSVRPGLVACGDGRNVIAYSPERAMHFINDITSKCAGIVRSRRAAGAMQFLHAVFCFGHAAHGFWTWGVFISS
jgi:hypothetical protein